MKFNHYINGQWAKPHSGEYFSVKNPFNQKVIASVAIVLVAVEAVLGRPNDHISERGVSS